ncbi:Hypothetical predicted protein [Cloeon dipterum]|uniref:Uncharacterized protein n=1 Tax=Cloeon dipterum TaxID=197152 RepID=A0A8S1C8P0_9INSE|nr:Hypothetical predicted protein [Cloeon dipterum]
MLFEHIFLAYSDSSGRDLFNGETLGFEIKSDFNFEKFNTLVTVCISKCAMFATFAGLLFAKRCLFVVAERKVRTFARGVGLVITARQQLAANERGLLRKQAEQTKSMRRRSISRISLRTTMLAGQARSALARVFLQHTPDLAPSRRALATTSASFSWFGKPEPAPAVRGPITNKAELIQFNAAFPDIVRNLTERGRQHLEVPAATKWFAQVLQYAVPGGKKNRGLAVSQAYKYLAQECTPEGLKQAHLMGWAVEMLHASLTVAQDALDGVQVRRGRPSWPVHCGLGLRAVNDAALLETGLYELLKTHFRSHPHYVEILELFHDVRINFNRCPYISKKLN